MNYLAHLVLSPPDAESMVGNLMGDFRKYLDDEALPRNVRHGINNHLRVDHFTDTNVLVRELKTCFSTRRRRFAGIIIDVAFDYFLIRNWQTFVAADLHGFVDRVHAGLSAHWELMPAHMQFVVQHMIAQDWLRSYASLEGIDNALNRMSARIHFDNQLAGAIEEIELNFEQMEAVFSGFFPYLIAHVQAADEGPVLTTCMRPGVSVDMQQAS